MNKSKVMIIRKQLEEKAREIEEVFNVKINIGRCTYNDSNCSYKIEVADIDENGEVKSKESEDFRLYASRFGLNSNDLGKEFNLSGKIYKITGLSVRKHKYPILATRIEDGEKFKFPAHAVSFALKKE